MHIIYKSFDDAEITTLCGLMKQLGYAHTEQSLMENVVALRKNGGEVFVALIDERVVGCASAIIDIRLAAGKTGEIVSVVVDDSYRGKGIGTGLIQQCESWLKDKVTTIRIRANTLRSQAPGFYNSLGYKLQKNQAVFGKAI